MAHEARAAFRGDRLGQLVGKVQMPLENMEYTVEQYLLDNGSRIDPDTRFFLACIRDSVGRIAVSARTIADAEVETQDGRRGTVCAFPAA